MKILAIDTTTNVASVCLTENKKLISEISINCKQNHSSILMPTIKQVMENALTDISEIDFIACCSGPGSFTGLRVGASTAKALALALDKNIISVPTLDSLAYNIHNTGKTIIPILDARASNVFTAFYKWDNCNFKQILQPTLKSISELLEYIKQNNINPIFIGEGAIIYRESILDFDPNFEIVDERFCVQKAYTLANLAYEYIKQGKSLYYYDFEIQYMRKSQAEIELEEKLKK